jgi:chemotaxis protein CheC
MSDGGHRRLNQPELDLLEAAFHQGSRDAATALSSWIERAAVVEFDSLEQRPIEQATSLLEAGDRPICACSTDVNGPIRTEFLLAFDDASGMRLTDLLLDQSPDTEGGGGDPGGRQHEWSEMAVSAALETTNILACAYLNALVRRFAGDGASVELIPSPPQFKRDFADSLLQFAVMGQAIAWDHVLVARTRFEVAGEAVDWRLLFVPAAETMSLLFDWLSGTEEC